MHHQGKIVHSNSHDTTSSPEWCATLVSKISHSAPGILFRLREHIFDPTSHQIDRPKFNAILFTLTLNLCSSCLVIVSAFAMMGMMFSLLSSAFIVTRSRDFKLKSWEKPHWWSRLAALYQTGSNVLRRFFFWRVVQNNAKIAAWSDWERELLVLTSVQLARWSKGRRGCVCRGTCGSTVSLWAPLAGRLQTASQCSPRSLCNWNTNQQQSVVSPDLFSASVKNVHLWDLWKVAFLFFLMEGGIFRSFLPVSLVYLVPESHRVNDCQLQPNVAFRQFCKAQHQRTSQRKFSVSLKFSCLKNNSTHGLRVTKRRTVFFQHFLFWCSNALATNWHSRRDNFGQHNELAKRPWYTVWFNDLCSMAGGREGGGVVFHGTTTTIRRYLRQAAPLARPKNDTPYFFLI